MLAFEMSKDAVLRNDSREKTFNAQMLTLEEKLLQITQQYIMY